MFSPYFWDEDKLGITKASLDIILLAHVQEPRGHICEDQIQCSDTERFSIDEFNEIYQGIVNAGFYIRSTFFNELDFISEFFRFPEKFRNCIIYNLARNGLGNNKKTIIPAFCELVGLRYSTSSSFSCALCRNKYYFTTLFREHEIPIPQSWLLYPDGEWERDAPIDGTRVICKPSSESASQGVKPSGIFCSKLDLYKKLTGIQYIIQEYIDGIECEVPVFKFGNEIKALPPVGIDLRNHDIMDENCSTDNDYSFYSLDTVLSKEKLEEIQRISEKAFRLLQMEVYGRIDFRINAYGEPFVIDVSTTPYTTKHSSFWFAFERLGLQYSEIYNTIIIASILRKQ